jgi:hypothetical protein
LIHSRTPLWLLVGLALPLAQANGQELPPPSPVGVALPTTPTWDQVIDGNVDLAQVPPIPGTARPPAVAPPSTARSLRNSLASSNDPNNPFATLNQPQAGAGTDATTAPGAPRLGFLQMIGDVQPISIRAAPAVPTVPAPPSPFPPKTPPNPPNPRSASALASSVRGFKIAENQSPQPQDRVFYSFNYYNNLNAATNKRFDTPINNVNAYREILGFEKTFDQGRASFGLIMPIDTLYAKSTIQGNFAKPGGASTAVGDLSIFTKFIVRQDPTTGSLFSGGLLVTVPTGPSTFAGANYITSIHTTQIQPYMGYILRHGKFYLHGFSAFAFPINPNDVSLIYNDAGLGYFLYQDTNEVPSGWITAVVPTTEIHINTPLNHQNVYNPNDIAGSANVVNLTQGLNIEFNRRSILTFGIATPITSPKPFDLEALLLFNVRFGGSRRTLPPILGG